MFIKNIKQQKITGYSKSSLAYQYFDNKLIVDYYIEVINFATKKVFK
tara:strand:+ start:398 stop:538 length:141 start_codon:yes stop_codon:yes gene_type:complete